MFEIAVPRGGWGSDTASSDVESVQDLSQYQPAEDLSSGVDCMRFGLRLGGLKSAEITDISSAYPTRRELGYNRDDGQASDSYNECIDKTIRLSNLLHVFKCPPSIPTMDESTPPWLKGSSTPMLAHILCPGWNDPKESYSSSNISISHSVEPSEIFPHSNITKVPIQRRSWWRIYKKRRRHKNTAEVDSDDNVDLQQTSGTIYMLQYGIRKLLEKLVDRKRESQQRNPQYMTPPKWYVTYRGRHAQVNTPETELVTHTLRPVIDQFGDIHFIDEWSGEMVQPKVVTSVSDLEFFHDVKYYNPEVPSHMCIPEHQRVRKFIHPMVYEYPGYHTQV